MTTIVFAHPWHGSFNKAILDVVTSKLEKVNKPYRVIDLNKDNFDPVVSEKDLSLYSKGGYTDPKVSEYMEILKETEEIVFIFPMWWHTMPAILKGFFDKVMLLDFAFNYEGGWNPLLSIEKATVITTSDNFTEKFKSSIEGEMFPNMLGSVGITNPTWYNLEQTSHGKTEEERKAFLQQMADLF